MAVCHKYLGSRVFQVSGDTVVGHIKELLHEETGFPVSEQRLVHNGKPVGDTPSGPPAWRKQPGCGKHDLGLVRVM